LPLGPAQGASRANRVAAVTEAFESLRFMAPNETWVRFRGELEKIGGVVELYLEGKRKHSPSAQLRINPRGVLEAMSTHDQVLGGRDGQSYLGCRFPAHAGYRLEIQEDALRVGKLLAERGCMGRVAVDFVTVEQEDGSWERYAIEINMRMTGTTHPIMTLKLLNDGGYDPERGLYITRRGEPRYYVSNDNVTAPHYQGLMPEDVLDIAAVHEVHYRPWTETGVVFHLLGASSEFGKMGATAIGASPEEADHWYARTIEALDLETKGEERDPRGQADEPRP